MSFIYKSTSYDADLMCLPLQTFGKALKVSNALSDFLEKSAWDVEIRFK